MNRGSSLKIRRRENGLSVQFRPSAGGKRLIFKGMRGWEWWLVAA
jgi:hypothetical protein